VKYSWLALSNVKPSNSSRGPEGVSTVDINGRAASIKCYLDLQADGLPPAEIVWTSSYTVLKTDPQEGIGERLRHEQNSRHTAPAQKSGTSGHKPYIRWVWAN
jgi:hypothetical protein